MGTLSPKNTSLTPCPIPELCLPILMTKDSLCCRIVKFSQRGYGHVCPRQPHACSHCWNVTESHTYTNTCKWLHRHFNAQKQLRVYTYVIQHVRNFYSVGHASICVVAQTYSVHEPSTFWIKWLYCFNSFYPSVYTETLQPGTSWSQRATLWRSQTLALPEMSTILTIIKRQQMWVHA